MRKVSAKRAKLLPTRARVVRQARERDRNRCQAPERLDGVTISVKGARNLPDRCAGPLDPHEIIPRSAWTRGFTELDNVLIVCRAHHDWIGDYPDDAAEAKLHGYSHDAPPPWAPR